VQKTLRKAAVARKLRRRNAISGQFASRLIEMLESPAYQVLSRAAHQVLARIEIESAHHGGVENGVLPVTYDNFVEYGVHRHGIAPAIRELVALGFIEVTQRGCAGNAESRLPSHYRLTYRNAKGEQGDGTHEWRKIKTIEEAEKLASEARAERSDRRAPSRKQKPNASLRKVSMMESNIEGGKLPMMETSTTA
jgi:hypothetical protein